MPVCAQCGTENPEGFRFCGACGASLDAPAAEERRERRIVSTLFADLAGFTRRSESLDVEDVEGFLDPYFAVLREEVERKGGLVAKFTGDGVMALFGAITAHEDDPERAVRCGLSICERVAELETGLHVRVGITTGEAMVTLPTDGHPDAIGDVVNTAARLEAAAPTDRVLVDEWTYRATSRAIHYEQADAVEAKGKAELVEVWVAVRPVSVVPEQQRDQLPLVGREAEADMLRNMLDRSRRERSAQLVSVIGEPGIGKSRLVEDLFAYVEELPELIIWRRGRSLSYGEGVAFWALGEMVKAQAGILESDSAMVADAKLSEAVAAVLVDERDRQWVAQHLRPLVGLEAVSSGGDGGRVEAFAAWRRFVEALAEEGPTVLVFEDIHWADEGLLDFIDLVADRAGAVPLLLVCTARPELFERREHWGGGKSNANTISLTPLSDEDTARLVGGLLDQSLLPAEVQQPLLAHAGGNPLYVQEYVRMLQDRDVLVHDAGGWKLVGDVAGLPESLKGIIAARLDTLSAEEKVLLQDAAVVGKTAWIGAVCALTERNTWQAEELLHTLERKQLVHRVRRSSIEGETEFQFGHALTRDVAYSQIRRADRAQKHEAAAQWIEHLAAGRDDKAELLADHYTQALSLRGAMGEPTSPIAPQALAAFTEAATQAAATHAHLAAARYFEAALGLAAPQDDLQRAALLLGQANALFDGETATPDLLEAAIPAQLTVGDWDAAAQIERMLGRWYQESGADGENAEEHLTRAAAYAARVPPSDTMCMIAYDQAFRLVTSGEQANALALVNQMIPLAEEGGLAIGRALLLIWRGCARVDLGDYDGVADMYEAAETLAEHAHARTSAAYGNLADTLQGLGDLNAVDDAYRKAAEWATRFALPSYMTWIASERAYQAYHAADWDTADRLLTQAAASEPSPFDSHHIRFVRAHLDLGRGDTTAASQAAAAVVLYSEGAENDDFLYMGLALEARCTHTAGNRQASADACDRLLTRFHENAAAGGGALIVVCEIALILVEANRHDDIRNAALKLPEICRWREALLLTADTRYAEAAALYTQIGSHPLAADAHLLAAHQASTEGRTTDATLHTQAVLAFAEQTGAVLYRRQAEQLAAASA